MKIEAKYLIKAMSQTRKATDDARKNDIAVILML